MASKVVIFGAVIIVLVVVALAFVFLSRSAPSQTSSSSIATITTIATSATTSIAPLQDSNDFLLNESYFTSAPGQYVVSTSSIQPQSAINSSYPPKYPGALYTAIFSMINASVQANGGVTSYYSGTFPQNSAIVVQSIVEVCNTSESAQNIMRAYSDDINTTFNATPYSIPQIGNSSVGLEFRSEVDTAAHIFYSKPYRFFSVQFVYRNAYVRIGAYEPLNSTSSPALVNASLKFLNTIKGALGS